MRTMTTNKEAITSLTREQFETLLDYFMVLDEDITCEEEELRDSLLEVAQALPMCYSDIVNENYLLHWIKENFPEDISGINKQHITEKYDSVDVEGTTYYIIY